MEKTHKDETAELDVAHVTRREFVLGATAPGRRSCCRAAHRRPRLSCPRFRTPTCRSRRSSAPPAGNVDKTAIFNNATLAWNHTFYWTSMRPKGGGAPPKAVADKIDAAFGGYDRFKNASTEAGVTQFASGWAWVVAKDGSLEIVKTPNAKNPISKGGGLKPVLTIDVWEHACCLDYQNKRPDYVAAYLDHLLNWEFAAANLG